MFNLHDFIFAALMDAVGKMADYQVMLNAAGWLEKGVLAEEDLAEIAISIELSHESDTVQPGDADE